MAAIIDRKIVEWADVIAEQERFYQEAFGIKLCLRTLPIPAAKRREGDYLFAICRELLGRFPGHPIDEAMKSMKCKRSPFSCTSPIAVDDATIHDRHPENGSYFVLVDNSDIVRDVEKSVSAAEIKEAAKTTETLLEHVIQCVHYNLRTGGSLDSVGVWTLCAGSRFRDCFKINDFVVPVTCYLDEQFNVLAVKETDSGETLRVRPVIVCKGAGQPVTQT